MCGGVGNGQRRRQHMYGASEKHGDAVDGGPLRSAASVVDTGQEGGDMQGRPEQKKTFVRVI